jgi:hypothetical protein
MMKCLVCVIRTVKTTQRVEVIYTERGVVSQVT